MKRLLILLCGALCALPAAAQDIILLRDASEIRADVKEVDERSIAYRNFGDETGPLRRIGRDRVVSITYANGEKEVYTDSADPSASASGEAYGDDYPWPPVSRSYRIGDLFSEGGVEGIVVRVDALGQHGLVMSVCGDWLAYDTGIGMVYNQLLCTDRNDGWANQCRLDRFLTSAGLSWDGFPAFAWCRSLGPGWYLPAIGELECLWHFSADGSAPRNMGQMIRICKRINELSRTYGGEDSIDWFFRLMFFWSSTEAPGEKALPLVWVHNRTRSLREQGMQKTKPLNVRAFHRF